jgi:hypothetical protein
LQAAADYDSRTAKERINRVYQPNLEVLFSAEQIRDRIAELGKK